MVATNLIKALRSTALLCCVVLFFVPGCSKRKQAETSLRLSSAKHFDIPSPLGFTYHAQRTVARPDYDYLVYTGNLSREKTGIFYQRELEKNGWEISDLSHPGESLLWCTKSHKNAAISIRSQSGKTAVHVFIKQPLCEPNTPF